MYKLLITTFLLLPFLLNAQTDQHLIAVAHSGTTVTATIHSDRELVAQHNRSAVAQLTDYLSENLPYPKHASVHGLEGIVLATVTLARDGRISNITISDNSLPNPFGAVLYKTLKGFDRLRFNGPVFRGSKRIKLPVSFSM